MLRIYSIVAMSATVIALCAMTRGQETEGEWKRVDDYYQRMIEVIVKRSIHGNVTGYFVDTKNDKIIISEIDENRGFNMESKPYGGLEVRKGTAGEIANYTVVLGKIRYGDLNGDGLIDTMYDGRERDEAKHFILIDGQFVEASLGRLGIQSDHARSPDRAVAYVFRNGRWMIEHDRRPAQEQANKREGGNSQEKSGDFVPPSAPVGLPPAPRSPIGRFDVPAEKRAQLREEWKKALGPAAKEEIFDYLYLVRPQPESVFVPMTEEKLDRWLVKRSGKWMATWFSPEANPYANIVISPPPPEPASEPLPAPLPVPSPSPEKPGKSDWHYLSRSRPARYYIAEGESLSLLFYEFENAGLHIRIQESSAAVLVQVRFAAREWDLQNGIPREMVEEVLYRMLNYEHLRATKRLPLPPFRMPPRLLPGAVFTNAKDLTLPPAQQLNDVDWSQYIIGFVTDQELAFILLKKQMIHGVQAGGHDSGNVSSHWLFDHLYHRDGETLVATGQRPVYD